MRRHLVTGVAGFVGFHTAGRLLARGDAVVGIDSLNDYYSVRLKRDRLDRLRTGADADRFAFLHADLADRDVLADVFDEPFDSVIHLAAQAGVRYSLTNPHAYVASNLTAFVNVLEACRHAQAPHLVYASSSSVYGANRKQPFAVGDAVDHPVSLYAATKKADELLAHSYSSLYGLPTTGLRFFTVYGPWGRPDMALWLFTEAILAGRPIDVFGEGRMRRDFTYVDDIVEGVVRVADRPATPNPDWDATAPDPATSYAPWRLYNIGNNRPVELMEMIGTLESALGRTADKRLLPMQPGDVTETFADIEALQRDVGFTPTTDLKTGVGRFVDWYRQYHRVGPHGDAGGTP